MDGDFLKRQRRNRKLVKMANVQAEDNWRPRAYLTNLFHSWKIDQLNPGGRWGTVYPCVNSWLTQDTGRTVGRKAVPSLGRRRVPQSGLSGGLADGTVYVFLFNTV